jgi:hypothetical protein
MLNTQCPQLLDVTEQLAVDVVFDFRHGGGYRPEALPMGGQVAVMKGRAVRR